MVKIEFFVNSTQAKEIINLYETFTVPKGVGMQATEVRERVAEVTPAVLTPEAKIANEALLRMGQEASAVQFAERSKPVGKPKRGRPSETESAPAPEVKVETAAAVPSADDVRAEINSCIGAKGSPGMALVQGILEEFGAKKIPDIKPEHRGAVIDAVRKAAAA